MNNLNQAEISDSEKVVAKTDFVTIDFEGHLKVGNRKLPFKGGSAKDLSVQLGAGHLQPPDFEAGIIGMKVGESRDVEVKFPMDWTPGLAGMVATFKVTLLRIRGDRGDRDDHGLI